VIDFQWLDPAFSGRICLTLLHSLWQVALFAVLASFATRVLRSSAERSYQFHLAALFAALVAIPVTYSFSLVEVAKSPVTTSANVKVSDMNEVAPYDISNMKSEDLKSTTLPPIAVPDERNSPQTSISSKSPSTETHAARRPAPKVQSMRSWQSQAPWIAVVYVFGVAAMLLRLAISVMKANRLRRECQPVTESRIHQTLRAIAARYSMIVVPVLLQAERAIVPQVIGFVRPVILLPTSAITGLTADELELILTHELAHVRRYDMWVALIQRLAEALLFFNPALWFLSRRISELREFCCDDIACRVDLKRSDPLLPATRNENQSGVTESDSFTSTVHVRYAQALLKVVEMSRPNASTHSQLASLAAGGRSPSELRRRMARLLGEPLREPVRISPGGLLICASVLVGLLLGPTLIPGQNSEPALAAAATPDEPAKDETHRTFRLTVNGPDGKPVPNASCDIRGTGPLKAEQVIKGAFVKTHVYGTNTTANEVGQLVLSLPRDVAGMQIDVEQSGFGPYWAAWGSNRTSNAIPEDATIELDAAWPVGGVVVDETGTPIEGVEVSPSIEFKKLPGETYQFGVGLTLKTDAKGEWRCDLIPVSKDYVFVAFDHPKHQPLRMPLPRAEYELKAGESPSKQIELPSGVTITGTVTDDQVQPIENALVRTKFVNEFRDAKTDQDGKYSIGGCESKMTRIVVSAKGRALEMRELLVDPKMQPVNFTLKAGGHVRIRVVDADGKGLAKSVIFFQRWRGGRMDSQEFEGIGEYTDDNGVWEWNDAPHDEFQADICRPGGFQLSYQPLIAREEEYVFSPPPALVISGKAIDAVTKQPVLNFRAVPATVDAPRLRGEHWDRDDAFEATDGHYRLTRTRDAPVHRVRFEAVGYKVATSRDINMDEGTIEVNVELQPAKLIAPVVLTPQGKPASGARIALGVKGDQISIRNGDLRDDNTRATIMTADAAGRFSMPENSDPFLMVIVHPDGFVSVTYDAPIPETIELSEWARAEGTYRINGEPAKNISVELHSSGLPSFAYSPTQASVQIATFATTDADGHYVLERVFPGTGRIGRRNSFMVHDGATEATSSKLVPVEFQCGKTLTTDFGNSPQAVTGKLLPPDGVAEPIAWSFARITVEVDLPVPPTPVPPAEIGDDPEKQNKWYAAWAETPEGKNWILKYQAVEAQRDQIPNYTVSVDRDGSFRIDDIPAGSYTLQMYSENHLPGSLPEIKFTVPADSEAASAMDLGEFKLIEK